MVKFLSTFFILFTLTSAHAETIRFITLNTWGVPLQASYIEPRMRGIAQKIENNDVVLLQEVFTSTSLSTLRKNLRSGLKAYLPQVEVTFPKVLPSGLAIVTSYKVLKNDHLVFESDCSSGLQYFAHKGIQYLKLETPKGNLVHVFNTHLQPFNRPIIRRCQLEQMESFISQKEIEGTIIVGGDFNIKLDSAEYVEMKDVFLSDYQVNAPEFTWNSNTNGFIKTGQRTTLDYLFYKSTHYSDIEVKDSGIMFDERIEVKNQTSSLIINAELALGSLITRISKKLINYSDHYANYIELDICDE